MQVRARSPMEPTVSDSVCCRVCGSAEVYTDEVADRHHGVLRLAECGRCDHRWTERRAPVVRVEPRHDAVPAAA